MKWIFAWNCCGILYFIFFVFLISWTYKLMRCFSSFMLWFFILLLEALVCPCYCWSHHAHCKFLCSSESKVTAIYARDLCFILDLAFLPIYISLTNVKIRRLLYLLMHVHIVEFLNVIFCYFKFLIQILFYFSVQFFLYKLTTVTTEMSLLKDIFFLVVGL